MAKYIDKIRPGTPRRILGKLKHKNEKTLKALQLQK